MLSLGIEPMILALLAPCSTFWATGKPVVYTVYITVACTWYCIYHQLINKGCWTIIKSTNPKCAVFVLQNHCFNGNQHWKSVSSRGIWHTDPTWLQSSTDQNKCDYRLIYWQSYPLSINKPAREWKNLRKFYGIKLRFAKYGSYRTHAKETNIIYFLIIMNNNLLYILF